MIKYRFSLSFCVPIKERVYGLSEMAAKAFFSLNIRAVMALDFTSDRRMILTALRVEEDGVGERETSRDLETFRR